MSARNAGSGVRAPEEVDAREAGGPARRRASPCGTSRRSPPTSACWVSIDPEVPGRRVVLGGEVAGAHVGRRPVDDDGLLVEDAVAASAQRTATWSRRQRRERRRVHRARVVVLVEEHLDGHVRGARAATRSATIVGSASSYISMRRSAARRRSHGRGSRSLRRARRWHGAGGAAPRPTAWRRRRGASRTARGEQCRTACAEATAAHAVSPPGRRRSCAAAGRGRA